MPATTTHRPRRVGVTFLVIAGLIASVAIYLLGTNISHDLRLLRSSQSENVQWSLSQIEVEFLDFSSVVEVATLSDTPNLPKLRQEFDIFFSRIATINTAPIYRETSQTPEFMAAMEQTVDFLNRTVRLIDGPDATLAAALDSILAQAIDLRPAIRTMSISSLRVISLRLDARRISLSNTLMQLAIVITVMGAIMGGLVVYLYSLNAQNLARGNEIEIARDQALQSEKIKTDFLAVMSHEIRTPLNGLLGNLSLLRGTDLSQNQQLFTRQMEASGRLLLGHVSDVLNITKYDAGHLTLNTTIFDPAQLVQDIVDSQRGTADRLNTVLTWHWSGVPCKWIVADRDGLQIILTNLVGNAIKFTRDGSIRIEMACHAGPANATGLTVTVSDTGIGMPQSLIDRVFEDFVTGDTSYDRASGGTGLGLGIAKRFATAMGGTITVTSEPEKGSVFTVSLPIRKSTVPPPQIQTLGAGPAHKLDVLLVEDNAINRDVARQMLTASGHNVTEVCNGAEGVAAAETTAFDLILMDIAMPVMDGRAATRAIRGGNGPNRDTPIIAVTANAMAREQAAFLADGMARILVKPVTRSSLRAAMAAVLPSALIPLDGPEADLSALEPRFIDEVTTLLDWLDTTPDPASAPAKLHRLAGSAAVFAAHDLRDALLTVEQSLLDGETTDLPDMVIGLRDIWAETRTNLHGTTA